jgi:FKBP-type peptidyl-prolyl cis-trans isomerase SlyD
MQIQKNTVVRFQYSVSEPGQEPIEKSREPMAVLIGYGSIIPGLEQALEGREAGESFEVTVAPEQAYGVRREGLVQRVPRKHFGKTRLVPGMQVLMPTRDGQRAMTVRKIGMSVVDVDLNHPLAGKTLNFAVEVVDVREATPEEINHKHVHGEGGHQH